MKLRFTYTIEYEVSDEAAIRDYQTTDPDQVLKIDLAVAEDDPRALMDNLVSIKGEVVKDPGERQEELTKDNALLTALYNKVLIKNNLIG